MNDEWLREQTARLFALANDARQKHEHDLADLVTEVACRCLDQLNQAEGKTPPRSRTPSETQQPPIQQQQQQIQPVDKE
jgi:hypothetical protein